MTRFPVDSFETDVNPLASILLWFQKAIPEPGPKNQTTQLGVHFEEVNELVEVLINEDQSERTQEDLIELSDELHMKSSWLKAGHLKLDLTKVDREALLDSLCDQIVTLVGTAHVLGLDILGAIQEVDRSNWSKFEDGEPVFDANRKIIKGKDYTKPQLDKFV